MVSKSLVFNIIMRNGSVKCQKVVRFDAVHLREVIDML
jgi:hypothetical protein